MTHDRIVRSVIVAAAVLMATQRPTVAQTPATSPKSTTQPARIEPFEQVPLFARIEGYISPAHTSDQAKNPSRKSSLADIGDRVKAGEVLAEVSVPELRQGLRQKQALYAQAEAEVEQATQAIIVAQKVAESARVRVTEAEAGIARATAEYELVRSERDRIQELVSRDSVTAQLGDEAISQFRAADAARGEVFAKVESAKAEFGEKEANIALARADAAAAAARLQVAQVNVDHIQTMLEYATIRAPFAGVVTERGVDTGHLVGPHQSNNSRPLFTIARTDVLRVTVDIPELEASLVDIGDRAIIRVQALGTEEIEARVTRTSFVLDPSSRTLRVEIDVANEAQRLRPGMYATVRIELDDQLPQSVGSKAE